MVPMGNYFITGSRDGGVRFDPVELHRDLIEGANERGRGELDALRAGAHDAGLEVQRQVVPLQLKRDRLL
jgi:hypothetical protein